MTYDCWITRARRLAILIVLAAPLLGGCGRNLASLDLSDAAITARVKAELKAHEEIRVNYMDIHTHARAVTLSGIVGSYEMKHRIKNVVRRVPGVRAVMINLVVDE